jgi:hypothetical protein
MKNYRNESEFSKLDLLENSIKKLEDQLKKLKNDKKEIIENIMKNEK